ncbi:flagellar hook-basal body complex protein FliE [Aquifex pyrophilus]
MEVSKLGLIPKIFKEAQTERSDVIQDFKNFVEWVNEKQIRYQKLKKRALEGKDIPLHEIVIEAEKAKVALNLLIEVRNKLLEAYRDLINMQV